MITVQDVVKLINMKIETHKKVIEQSVESLQSLKGRQLTEQSKMELVRHASTIAEQKAAITTLSQLLVELE